MREQLQFPGLYVCAHTHFKYDLKVSCEQTEQGAFPLLLVVAEYSEQPVDEDLKRQPGLRASSQPFLVLRSQAM